MPEMRVLLPKIKDYPAFLEEAWQAHLAPRKTDAPTVISLFAGCGGSSLGYSMAGYRELLAVDWDKAVMETFRLNFPGVPTWQGDIHDLSGDEAMRLAGVGPGELDVLDGSPPCQGFSTAGNREIGDSRNLLSWEFLRLLQVFSPKVCIMENVSGMVKGKMKTVFTEIIRGFQTGSYRVSARLLNTKYFAVPQSRERLIFIGVKAGIGKIPSHPYAQFSPIPVSQALTGCTVGDFTVPRSYRKWSARLRPGQSVQDLHPKGFGFNMRKLDPNRPAFTCTRTHTPAVGLLHPYEDRFLSIEELKRLSSFPEGFIFPTGTTPFMSRQSAWAGIGNSVPPLFMQAIAAHIRQVILDNSSI